MNRRYLFMKIWIVSRFMVLWPLIFCAEFVAVLYLFEVVDTAEMQEESALGEVFGFILIGIVPVLIISAMVPLLLFRWIALIVPKYNRIIQFVPYLVVGFFASTLAWSFEVGISDIGETPLLPIVLVIYAAMLHVFEFRSDIASRMKEGGV